MKHKKILSVVMMLAIFVVYSFAQYADRYWKCFTKHNQLAY